MSRHIAPKIYTYQKCTNFIYHAWPLTCCCQAIDDDDEDWGEDTSEEAVQQRMQELSSAAKTLTINDDVEKPQQQRIDILYAFVKVSDATVLLQSMQQLIYASLSGDCFSTG